MTAARDDDVAADLYGRDPDDFVPERDRRVAELKAADEPELARRVAGLRKPVRSAWAVDQVALHDRDVLDAVLAAGDAVRAAAGADDPAARRTARRDLQDRVATARRRAAAHLERIGSDPAGHLPDVVQTLTTAAVDPDQRREVVAGRLVQPLGPAGFDALSGVDLPEGAGRDRDRDRRERRRARQELQERATALSRTARRAAARAERLRAEADEAAREAAKEQQRLARVEAELAELTPSGETGSDDQHHT